jgi:hypothetical protein
MKTASTTKKWKRITYKRVGLAGLKKELAAFEKKYGMPTETFVKKVWSGELEESKDFIMWLGHAEIYQDMMNGRKA